MTKTISEIKSFLDDLKIHYTEREDESRSCISVTSQRKDGSTYKSALAASDVPNSSAR